MEMFLNVLVAFYLNNSIAKVARKVSLKIYGEYSYPRPHLQWLIEHCHYPAKSIVIYDSIH